MTQARESATVEYVPMGAKDKIKLSVAIVLKHLCRPTKSGKLCSESDAMRFLMLCRARELDPWQGDAFLVGYDAKDGPEFNLITAHQAFLKRAEVNVNFDGMESGVIVQQNEQAIDREGDFMFEGEILLGAWATVYVRNRRIPTKRRINFKTFAKDNRFWRDSPAGMIVKCAEADALRSTFPTTLGGLYFEAERQPVEVAQVDAEPAAPPVGRNRIGKVPSKPREREPEATENGNGQQQQPAAVALITPELQAKIREAVTAQGIDAVGLSQFVHKFGGRRQLEDMALEDAQNLLAYFTEGGEFDQPG